MELPRPESPEGLRENIRYLARQVGFDDCRIARANEAGHAAEFREWLEQGMHGEMAWLERDPERRCDPRNIVSQARSVIVVALNYLPREPLCGTEKTAGRIARYAWNDDYHDVIEPRLRDIGEYIDAIGGRQRCYVDTGPMLERDFASDSGLGWNGKSTVQIHRKLGTWFFLGTIVTDLEIAPDEKLPDRCGSCTRCMDACPTRAIVAPHRLDARRCISYLTIEHPGPIPEEFRVAIGNRIYGCDDCLEVCPWNRFASASREMAFQARQPVFSMRLRDYLALDEEGFRRLFRKSPIKRIKRERMLRNVCVALGNVGDSEDLAALEKAAQEEGELIAEHACWAIERIRERGREV
jgi:epoxyqueuosine reductase